VWWAAWGHTRKTQGKSRQVDERVGVRGETKIKKEKSDGYWGATQKRLSYGWACEDLRKTVTFSQWETKKKRQVSFQYLFGGALYQGNPEWFSSKYGLFKSSVEGVWEDQAGHANLLRLAEKEK